MAFWGHPTFTVTALDSYIADLHDSDDLVDLLADHGLPATAADVGKPRLIK